MKRLFLLAGVLMLIGGLSTMNAEVIYVTENGVGDGKIGRASCRERV